MMGLLQMLDLSWNDILILEKSHSAESGMFKDFFAAVLSWLHSSVLQRHIWEQRNVFCLFGQRYKGTFGHHSGAITLEYVLLDHFFTSRSSGEAENKELEEKMIQIFTSRSSTTGTEKQMSVPARTCRLSSSKYFNSFPPT